MILCVTLNACLDKTLTVPDWKPGDLVRGRAVREVVGGKGNNVARALSRLGREARPVTFLGRAIGNRCERLLRQADGLDPLVIETQAETRVILTVRTEGGNRQTAFFDPDPAITDTEAEALFQKVEQTVTAGGVDLITLSGSSPSKATDHLYSDLISLARTHRVVVLLDTYGKALDAIWEFWPDVIQLNRREAAGYLGKPSGDLHDENLLDLFDDWVRHGVKVGLVTNGSEPVYAFAHGLYMRCEPPHIEAVNPIGSGDSLLAGLADGWLRGLDPESLLRRGLACGVSNALTWDAGQIDPDQIERLALQVSIERLEHTPAPGSRSGPSRKS